jgi:multidrug efflux pump subunit AcrB
MLRQLPPGTLPPQIINFSASSVPILQLGISGDGLSEAQLNDYATNFVRTQLITVPGATVPSPYGGKQRQITVNMNQIEMQSKGIAPGDILSALAAVGVRRPDQRRTAHGGGPSQYPSQAGEWHDHLPARRRQRK